MLTFACFLALNDINLFNYQTMAIRIVGVDLPQNKRGEIALTYIYGIGRSSSAKILDKAGISRDLKVSEWSDDQAAKIREIIGAEFKVEGDLRSEIQMNIKRLMDIGCYRGVRHRNGLPVRGQRLRTMLVPVRERRRLLLIRRRLLSNSKEEINYGKEISNI